MARDTKLEEDITRDIPNVNEEALKNLEVRKVYIGAEENLETYWWVKLHLKEIQHQVQKKTSKIYIW